MSFLKPFLLFEKSTIKFMIMLGMAIIVIAVGNENANDREVVPIIGNAIPVIPCRKEAMENMSI